MKTERIYIIGAGFIAGTHANAMSYLPDAESIELHVSDVSDAALAAFAEKFPGAITYTDTGEMLAEPAREGDIVIVSTPPNGHAPLTLAALESGRHVLCEKPFAMDVTEARAMLAKAREVDRLVGCCSSRFLAQPRTEAVKNLIAEGKLGDLYHVRWCSRSQRSRSGMDGNVRSRWFIQWEKAGGGILANWGPYDFSTLNDILAPEWIEVQSAWVSAPDAYAELPDGLVPDVEFHGGAMLVYHLPGGGRVHVNYERSACTHGPERHIFEVEGDKGAAAFQWARKGSVMYSHDRCGEVVSEEVETGEDSVSMLAKPLVFFHEAVHGRESAAVINEAAVFNFACIHAIYDCAKSGAPQIVAREDFM